MSPFRAPPFEPLPVVAVSAGQPIGDMEDAFRGIKVCRACPHGTIDSVPDTRLLLIGSWRARLFAVAFRTSTELCSAEAGEHEEETSSLRFLNVQGPPCRAAGRCAGNPPRRSHPGWDGTLCGRRQVPA